MEIRSGGDVDPTGRLLDSDGNELAVDQDSGTGFNFRILHTLAEDVYYVAVNPDAYGGDYGVIARTRRTGDDHGDTVGASTRLAQGIRTAGQINPDSDVDVFRLDVSEPVDARITAGGSTDTMADLLNSNETVFLEAVGGGIGDNFEIQSHLLPGVYYVLASAAAKGAYNVRYEDTSVGSEPGAHVRNLLGSWAGMWRWSFGGVSLRGWEFDRLLTVRGSLLAVEQDHDPTVSDDASYYLGARVDGTEDCALDYDYVVLYRGFDILCLAYFFDLSSPASGNGFMLFGDVSEGECTFEGASVYETRVARMWPPGTMSPSLSEGAPTPATDQRTALLALARRRSEGGSSTEPARSLRDWSWSAFRPAGSSDAVGIAALAEHRHRGAISASRCPQLHGMQPAPMGVRGGCLRFEYAESHSLLQGHGLLCHFEDALCRDGVRVADFDPRRRASWQHVVGRPCRRGGWRVVEQEHRVPVRVGVDRQHLPSCPTPSAIRGEGNRTDRRYA